ncbi:hypothetical protein [Microbacterium sp.]|uniref:hypothetical protein n=1 Tax=Microbacterium sp. TaxID=51671 RepID=UPI003736DEC5
MSLFAAKAPTLGLGALPRVDLLPPSEVRRRETAARARAWAMAAVGALVVSASAVAGAFAFNMSAGVRLAAEQQRTQTLLASVAELADVSRALSLRSSLQALRADAMAGDLRWIAALDTIAETLPTGIRIVDYALIAGPVPDVALPDAAGLTGTVTVSSAAPIDLSSLTRTLRDVDAVQVTEVDELTSEADSGFEYRLRVQLDQSVYSGDFVADGADS